MPKVCEYCGGGYGEQYDAAQSRAEIERLRAENTEQKAEMQTLYDNWIRVLALKDPTP